MTYYFNKVLVDSFDNTIRNVTRALKDQGFGLLTDIDVQTTLKQKIGAEFRSYRILGACNPALAHKALTVEDKIGVMLPCNVIVQDLGDGRIEVAAINPTAAMGTLNNASLTAIAEEVASKLQAVIAAL